MNRRQFILSTSAATFAPSLGFTPSQTKKTHLLSFSFDDGFRKSFIKLASIHEEYGLKACLNVIATGHSRSFRAVDDWILPELMGDFNDWNTIVDRGHELMPHSWEHNDLTKLDPYEAKKLISKCIVYFNEHLIRFAPKTAVFNFPYNASNSDLEQHALRMVGAVRTRSSSAINAWPSRNTRVLGCNSRGPENIDGWVDEQVDRFFATDGGWLILNLHGLDNEGWGPISTEFFISLLKRLISIKKLEIIPVGMALKKYAWS